MTERPQRRGLHVQVALHGAGGRGIAVARTRLLMVVDGNLAAVPGKAVRQLPGRIDRPEQHVSDRPVTERPGKGSDDDGGRVSG